MSKLDTIREIRKDLEETYFSGQGIASPTQREVKHTLELLSKEMPEQVYDESKNYKSDLSCNVKIALFCRIMRMRTNVRTTSKIKGTSK